MEQQSKFISNKDYMVNSLSADIEDFVKGGRIKSGYRNLDLITNLYPGFYVLGAVSSLGKTTFIHQMADQIACAGQSVLFFSLEQTRLELTTKSLSRIMAQVDARTARTSLQIRKGRVDERVMAAERIYNEYANNVYVVENTFSATMESIENDVEIFIKEKRQKPVVVIDYLQVIQPPEGSNKTAKDLVDMHVSRLKKLQAKHKLVMMVVSSFNRQNYLTQVDFESFKEQVRSASDIVEVISNYVSLKKRGQNYWGCCPFHGEKTPSFAVNPAKNMFYCFGCHEGGDIFKFIMKIENCGFVDALKLLAGKYGIPVPEKQKTAAEIKREQKKARIYDTN